MERTVIYIDLNLEAEKIRGSEYLFSLYHKENPPA